MTDFRHEYEHKTVTCGFYGASVNLATSQELFSSFEVDPGSSLLLHSVGSRLDVDSLGTVLDVGCGVGTLALALAAKNPRLRGTCVDRDALALAFTERNARANGIAGVTCLPSLGTSDVPYGDFDLVMSNIPAKAGNPVIERMLRDFSAAASRDGVVAVVIVRTLSDFARDCLVRGGAEILHEHVTREYTVYHYRGASAPPARAPATRDATVREPGELGVYSRGTFGFSRGGRQWTIDSVFGIPEFDSLDHATELGIDLLGNLDLRSLRRASDEPSRVLVVNPGQGHVPVFLSLATKDDATDSSDGTGADGDAPELRVAGRDLLALRATEAAVRAATGDSVATSHVPWLGRIDGRFDLVCVNCVKEAVPRAHELLAEDLARLVEPGGTLVVSGSSTLVQRLDSVVSADFARVKDVRRKGCRAVRYERKDR